MTEPTTEPDTVPPHPAAVWVQLRGLMKRQLVRTVTCEISSGVFYIRLEMNKDHDDLKKLTDIRTVGGRGSNIDEALAHTLQRLCEKVNDLQQRACKVHLSLAEIGLLSDDDE